MTHTSTEQPKALPTPESVMDQAQVFASAWALYGSGSILEPEDSAELAAEEKEKLAVMVLRLHARVQELEASREHLKNALEDIASGEITRSHCVGPHCTEEIGVATADEMASRAAGALHWHGITQEKQG